MFIENKYNKWYFSIIKNAKIQNRIKYKRNNIKWVYYENHHIIPLCMGGTETVLLTAKEHFICHLLLCKMTSGKTRHKMINAIIKMSFSKSDKQFRYTSNSFSLIRKFIAEKNSEMFKGKTKSENTKNNMKGNSGKWLRTEKHRLDCSVRNKGKNIGELNASKRPEIRKILSEKSKISGNNPTDNIILGREKMKNALSKKRWFTDGKNDVFVEKCPLGFKSGRTLNRKEKRIAP